MESIPKTFARAIRAAANRKGVTYSRSITGTRMPLKERFQTRPNWACLQTLSFKPNIAFRDGQQPKPQICCLFFLVWFLADADD
jgi:hypothetical protein